MKLALFDLDNTLLNGDSDQAWNEFLIKNDIVDKNEFRQATAKFHEDYHRGALDIRAYQKYVQAVLAKNSMQTLLKWRSTYMHDYIEPLINDATFKILEKHREKNDILVIVSATNEFLVTPIASRLGIKHIISTKCKMKDGSFVGALSGIPCYQVGKVLKLQKWLQKKPKYQKLTSIFYSDSHNDIPLLEFVDKPIAVDPDLKLKQHALKHDWKILNLHKNV